MKRPDGHYTTCPNEDCPDIQCRDRRRLEQEVNRLKEELMIMDSRLAFVMQERDSWQREFDRSERYKQVAKRDVKRLQQEVEDLEYLLNHINSFVVPGQTDSIDSLKAMLKELEELRAKK
jgi:cob(I)alamin adenosyltransferase